LKYSDSRRKHKCPKEQIMPQSS